MLKKYEWLLALGVIVLFALFLQLQLFPNIADPDGFYHLQHALQYRTHGIFHTDFPWAQYSSVRTYAADLWYGFHLLLIPFTFFNQLIYGFYWGSLFVTIASLLLAYAALKRLEVRWPIFWTMVFAAVTADLMYRLAMLRPHPLSLGLTLLLFSYLIKTPRKLRELWPPFLIAAVFTWLHISLSWVMLVTLGAILAVQLLQTRRIEWRSALSVAAGMALGWLLRPNPLGALKLAYIQVVELMLIKGQGLPLRFGRELSPFVWENFVDQLIPITILVMLAAAFFFSLLRRKKIMELAAETRLGLWSSGLLMLGFFGMTFGVARRSNELFVGFAVILIALLFTRFSLERNRGSLTHTLTLLTAVIALTIAPVKNLVRLETYTHADFPPFFMKPAADWLAQHAKPQEIVFSPHWDRFGELFFWDPRNYYINGMDPVFEYDYSHRMYWETHFYATDAATGYTCPKIRCTGDEVVDTHTVLVNDFHASYVVIEKKRSPSFAGWLASAPGFKKVFENPDTEVFFVLP